MASQGGISITRSLKTIQDEIKACNASFKSASREARGLAKSLKLDPKNIKLNAAYAEQLQRQLDSAAKKVNLLREQQKRLVEVNGDVAKNTDQYKKLDIEIEKAAVSMRELNREIEKTTKSADKLGTDGVNKLQKFQQVAGGIRSAFSEATKTFSLFIGTLMGVGAAYAATADKIGKASEKLGITAEQYQVQRNRWEQLTGEASMYEKVLGAVVGLNGKAEQENAELQRILERLGYTFEDLKGMNPAEALEVYMEALRNCSDETERANLATLLFGANLGPWVAQMATTGAAQLEEYDKWLEQTGILTNEQVKKGSELQGEFDKLKQSIKVMIADSGEQLIGFTKSMINVFTALTPIITSVASALSALGPAGITALATIGALVAAIPPLVVMMAALNASKKQYVAAFTSLAILGTVATIGTSAFVAANQNGASQAGTSGVDSKALEDDLDYISSGQDTLTTYNENKTTNSNDIYIEDNSVNTYNINNEMDVEEVIETLSDARRGMIGG